VFYNQKWFEDHGLQIDRQVTDKEEIAVILRDSIPGLSEVGAKSAAEQCDGVAVEWNAVTAPAST